LPWPIRARVLRAWLEELGHPVSDRLLREVAAAINRGGRTGLPGRAVLATEGGWVRVLPRTSSTGPPARALAEGEPVEFGGFRVWLGHGPGVPVGAAPAPLLVRARMPGDRVGPESGPSRRVQDVLVDAAVPVESRAAWPLVADARGRVLWVVGLWPHAHPGPGPFLQAEPIGPRPSTREQGSL